MPREAEKSTDVVEPQQLCAGRQRNSAEPCRLGCEKRNAKSRAARPRAFFAGVESASGFFLAADADCVENAIRKTSAGGLRVSERTGCEIAEPWTHCRRHSGSLRRGGCLEVGQLSWSAKKYRRKTRPRQ